MSSSPRRPAAAAALLLAALAAAVVGLGSTPTVSAQDVSLGWDGASPPPPPPAPGPSVVDAIRETRFRRGTTTA